MDYVTDAGLRALLGPGADPARVTLAVAAANQLIGVWSEPDPALPAPVSPTDAQEQAGLELAHTLYRRHAAVGGVFSIDELVSRLPQSVMRPIRDLVNADRHRWGVA